MTPLHKSLARARADISSALELQLAQGSTSYPLAVDLLPDRAQALAGALAPDAAQVALVSHHAALDLLTARDWHSRAAAMLVIVHRHELTSEVLSRFVQIAVDDEVPEVRGFAIIVLADLLNADQLMGGRIYTAAAETFSLNHDVAVFWLNAVSCEVLRARSRRTSLAYRSEQLAKRAGPYAASLLRGQGTAYRFLDHEDPNLRTAALDIICEAKNMGIWAGKKVIEMAATDIDYGVRISAVGTCASIFAKTKEPAVERFLASIVLDASKHTYIREIAYHALFRVHDIPVSEWPDCKAAACSPPKVFTFPEDADMDFVRRCLRE